MTQTTITVTNPWSNSTFEMDVSDYTHDDIAGYAVLVDDETLYEIGGCESGTDWLVKLANLLGPEETGRIIIGS